MRNDERTPAYIGETSRGIGNSEEGTQRGKDRSSGPVSWGYPAENGALHSEFTGWFVRSLCWHRYKPVLSRDFALHCTVSSICDLIVYYKRGFLIFHIQHLFKKQFDESHRRAALQYFAADKYSEVGITFYFIFTYTLKLLVHSHVFFSERMIDRTFAEGCTFAETIPLKNSPAVHNNDNGHFKSSSTIRSGHQNTSTSTSHGLLSTARLVGDSAGNHQDFWKLCTNSI